MSFRLLARKRSENFQIVGFLFHFYLLVFFWHHHNIIIIVCRYSRRLDFTCKRSFTIRELSSFDCISHFPHLLLNAINLKDHNHLCMMPEEGEEHYHCRFIISDFLSPIFPPFSPFGCFHVRRRVSSLVLFQFTISEIFSIESIIPLTW